MASSRIAKSPPFDSNLEETTRPAPSRVVIARVEAAASDSGPIDLLVDHRNGVSRSVIERFVGGPPTGSRLADYQRASPINHLGGKTPPLLLIYGEIDNQVDVKTADRFVEELSRTGHREISYFRLAGVGHCPHSLVGATKPSRISCGGRPSCAVNAGRTSM
jgi:hypothetical protein